MNDRIYKFRAWDKEKKVMLIFHLLSMSDHLGTRLREGDFELMQYTGLKDKNGKEIYEGDIVSGIYGTNWEVKYEAPTWKLTRDIEARYGTLDAPTWSNLEVIGNVYENPNLLQEEKGERND